MQKNFDLSTGQLSRGISTQQVQNLGKKFVGRGVCFDLEFGSSILRWKVARNCIFPTLFFLCNRKPPLELEGGEEEGKEIFPTTSRKRIEQLSPPGSEPILSTRTVPVSKPILTYGHFGISEVFMDVGSK